MGLATKLINSENAKRERRGLPPYPTLRAGVLHTLLPNLDSTALRFGDVRVEGGRVRNRKTGEGGSLAGSRATVETSGEIESRFTVTRLAMFGPFALGMKKKRDKRQLFLTVEGEDFAFMVSIDPKKEAEARQFAARLNTRAK